METLQENQEMTMDMHRAIKVLEDLLFEFTIRSAGGPDCILIREAEEAIRLLRSLQKQQENRQ